MTTQNYIQDDEIDLKNLVNIIWNGKIFIIFFTLAITILSAIYILFSIPVYEAKSVVRIGYIDNVLLEEPKVLEQKLKLIFDVENNNPIEENSAYVTKINIIKGVENLLQIITESNSKDLAIQKNKDVINFIKDEYKYKIDEFVLKTQTNIKSLEHEINYIENVVKVNLQKEIDKINIEQISKINDKIRLLKEQEVAKIDEKIRLLKEQDIFKIDEKISFLQNIELKSIDNKIRFNELKLKEYEDTIVEITKQKSNDNTQNMLMSMQLLNTQNLILNIQNQIENLNKEKENIIDITIKDLELQKKNLIDITLNDLKIQKKNLFDITLKELELQKKNLINDEIYKIQTKLDIDIPKQILDLQDKINFEKLNIANKRAMNSKVIGDIIANDYPIKPKKSLIIIVSFVTGVVLSIFILLLHNFFREEKIKKTEC